MFSYDTKIKSEIQQFCAMLLFNLIYTAFQTWSCPFNAWIMSVRYLKTLSTASVEQLLRFWALDHGEELEGRLPDVMVSKTFHKDTTKNV